MSQLSYLEAIVMGAIQGISELFPISSLGHSIIIPALIGGRWANDLNVARPESPYLAFIVGLHVATALALLLFFWRDWVRLIVGFFTSIRHRRISNGAERLIWLLILATIPVGLIGLLLEHAFRTVLGQPLPAAAFLAANGVILFLGEGLRRRAVRRGAATADAADQRVATLPATDRAPATDSAPAERYGQAGIGRSETYRSARANTTGAALARETDGTGETDDTATDAAIARIPLGRGILIGASQALALLPGISRSGIAMVAGMAAGLTHREAMRFSFLLATPVILAAGVLKLPDLFGPLGAGIGGQVLAGSAASFVCALLAVGFLDRYFRTRTLLPFAVYCLVAGVGSFVYLSVR